MAASFRRSTSLGLKPFLPSTAPSSCAEPLLTLSLQDMHARYWPHHQLPRACRRQFLKYNSARNGKAPCPVMQQAANTVWTVPQWLELQPFHDMGSLLRTLLQLLKQKASCSIYLQEEYHAVAHAFRSPLRLCSFRFCGAVWHLWQRRLLHFIAYCGHSQTPLVYLYCYYFVFLRTCWSSQSRQGASEETLQVKAASFLPLVGLARPKQDPINRGYGAWYLYHPHQPEPHS
jgi:hypothetical protein